MHEGRNRQVRRMVEAVGNQVVDLDRVRFGALAFGELREGRSRRLRPAEIQRLWKDAPDGNERRLWAVRGAVKVDSNDVHAILAATEELMRELMSRNDLTAERMVSWRTFTASPTVTRTGLSWNVPSSGSEQRATRSTRRCSWRLTTASHSCANGSSVSASGMTCSMFQRTSGGCNGHYRLTPGPTRPEPASTALFQPIGRPRRRSTVSQFTRTLPNLRRWSQEHSRASCERYRQGTTTSTGRLAEVTPNHASSGGRTGHFCSSSTRIDPPRPFKVNLAPG